jgi:hypothetical protein
VARADSAVTHYTLEEMWLFNQPNGYPFPGYTEYKPYNPNSGTGGELTELTRVNFLPKGSNTTFSGFVTKRKVNPNHPVIKFLDQDEDFQWLIDYLGLPEVPEWWEYSASMKVANANFEIHKRDFNENWIRIAEYKISDPGKMDYNFNFTFISPEDFSPTYPIDLYFPFWIPMQALATASGYTTISECEQIFPEPGSCDFGYTVGAKVHMFLTQRAIFGPTAFKEKTWPGTDIPMEIGPMDQYVCELIEIKYVG